MELNSNLHTALHLLRQNPFNRIKFLTVLIALILGLTTKSYSKNFYFSSSTGNDSYTATQARNPATPWRTIDKLNSSMSLIDPGDSILFKRGDVFTGQINLSRSGSLTGNIIFGSYGGGKNAIIQGDLEISDWIRSNGNIWVSNCPQLGSTVTNLLINGKSQQIGRYPNSDATNKGYLLIKSHSGKTQIRGYSLLSSPNWTGAEAVVRSARWVLDRVPILSHQGDVLIFSKPTTYDIKDNFGFFIQNHPGTLDQQGEWYFDSGSKRMYLYSSVDPNTLQTQAAAFSSTFSTSDQRYFSIENIEFIGSLKTALNIIGSDNIEMRNITISESGADAVYFLDCNNVRFINNKIVNSNNNALAFYMCENIFISNNTIHHAAIRSGMGLGSDQQYTSLFMTGNNISCESNMIDSVGYIGIRFEGDLVTVKNNYINHYCMTLDDGGGLYTYSDGKSENYSRKLESNIILNGIGAGEGTDNPAYLPADGIYMDDRTTNVEIINNTVANCNNGILIHNSDHISITGNTLYNNNTQLLFSHDSIATEYPITNCTVKNNVFYAKSDSQMAAKFVTIDNGIPNFGTFDKNYYCRPTDDIATIYTEYVGDKGNVSNLIDLGIWQSTYNYDPNSKKSPFPIPAYKIINLIGTSKIGNSNFNSDVKGWDYWSTYYNGYASWENNSNLDGGCLKLGFNSSSGKPDGVLVTVGSFGEANAGRNYILKFSMIASYPGKIVKITLRKDDVLYKDIAPAQYISVDTKRKEYELLFTPNSNETNAHIDFEINEEVGPIWIDNVELFEANIQITNIEDFIKFAFNPKNTVLTINDGNNYVDVKGTKYSGSITLLPYTSAVLMVDPDTSAPPAIPVYVSSAIENATPAIIEMAYNLSLANTVPAKSAFLVQVNSVARSVNSVSISGSKVLLTLVSPVANGNAVTVAYTAPSSNPLQTSAGGKAASLEAQTVTNRVNPPASPVYVSSSVENSSPSVIEITYSLALANIVPAASAFSVQVNSAVRGVNSVSISGTKVLLTLASPVANGNAVTVAYTAPLSNPLQTSAGGKAASHAAQTVTNRVNPPASPVYVSSAVENATPSVIEITYSLALAIVVPATSAFSVQVNSVARSINSVSVSGTKVSLTLSVPVVNGNTVTVAYTAPSSNPLQTSAGGKAASHAAQTVTNRVNPPLTSPVYVSSAVENAAPSVIEITYSLALAIVVPATSAFSVQVNSIARSINSVSVSGTKVSLTLSSPVVNGNTVTVAYTAPLSNPLQTSAGGKAASHAAQTVTNRVNPPASPVYVSSVVENATPSVIEITYSLALAIVVPTTSAFSVQVNSVARSINSVSVSGTKVSLTLSVPVVNGNTVTVAYTAPSSNPLQTSAGGKAASHAAQTVTNRVNPPLVSPVYVSSAVENAAPSVIEITYSFALANVVPATSAFSVQVNSVTRSVNSISVSGTKVSLTLSSPIANGNVITVGYTAPLSNPLQTSAGGKASSHAAQTVINRVNPPASPVYMSSSVENDAPSVIEITYSLELANIVPATSAFSVQVNSVTRSVNSISVSGTKVSLTLSVPIINGNAITVAYAMPSSNPLQTITGGKAATISGQAVSNHVNSVSPPNSANAAPIVVVNYFPSNNAGFVSELNASGSYDSNKDILTFNWKVPDNIPVYSTNNSILQFLAPVTDVSHKYEFILTVSDGKATQSKTLPVEIIPYQPELEAAEVKSIDASASQYPFLPSNIIDGEIGTMWSANGNDQWIILELMELFNIQHIKIAFQPGQRKEFYLDILGSDDKEAWEPILIKSNSCAFSGNLQVFEFPPSKTTKEYKYVKLVGHGNSVDRWNYISEFKIFGARHRNSPDYEEQIVKVYPNPAHDLVNILINEKTFIPDFIKIVSLAGKVFFNYKVDPGLSQFQIPINFTQGIYTIQMGIGNITMFTQKLIIIN